MMTTWVLAAAIVAEVAGGPMNPAGKRKPTSQSEQAVVIPLSGATMTCTKEADHLVCVIPLEKDMAKDMAKESEPVQAALPKAKPYKPSQPTLTLPGPEVFAQLKAAEANIELAKSLLPKATSPEETVLVQQMLYRARDQYRTARALLHTVQGDLHRAPDPFDGDKQGDTVALCRTETDLAEDCQTAVP